MQLPLRSKERFRNIKLRTSFCALDERHDLRGLVNCTSLSKGRNLQQLHRLILGKEAISKRSQTKAIGDNTKDGGEELLPKSFPC